MAAWQTEEEQAMLNELEGGGLAEAEREEDLETTSQYVLTRREIAKNLANRIVHSRAYVFLYLLMTGLSAVTVGLSLAEGCPPLAFYVLEVIINGAMIVEVTIRFVALGRAFLNSHFNNLDLGLTCFCAITLVVLAITECGTSKSEELLDTLLLVARNVLQLGRLAAIMRKSGQSIFSRPKPIDLRGFRGEEENL